MTTPHADRDRSEPWWPPAAPAGYAIHTTEPSVVVEPFLVPRDLDEPVPYILTDEPVGELVQAFPLDEGDTGDALLPAAPEGIELQCSMCPATLADTRGGVLWHHEDGSHTLVPADPMGVYVSGAADGDAAPADEQRRTRYADACGAHSWHLTTRHFRQTLDAVIAVADAEQADLRADRDLWKARATIAQGKVARVAALHTKDPHVHIDTIHRGATDVYGDGCIECGVSWPCDTIAALAEPEPETTVP